MKDIYLDIMEKSLAAYSDERIWNYISTVKREGLTEHGFPRLGANIGILMAHGRCLGLKDAFIEIMDLCVYGFAHPIRPNKAGNNFAIREVCHAIMELEKTDVIDRDLLKKWKDDLAAADVPILYTHIVSEKNPTPANWAYFGVASEIARGLLCGLDTDWYVDHQLPSQLLRLDENGMYEDGDPFGCPHQPIIYELLTRNLLGLSLFMGYNGKYVGEIEKMMQDSDDLTLKMQSVTGEIAFGGRSNQCIHNEPWLASYCELRATLLKKKGDLEKAGLFKAAAKKAAETAMWWLDQRPLSHIKNHFNHALQLGCEAYSYFNKYMITTASNAYLAYLAADDSIEPSIAPADTGGYVAVTSDHFHKVVMNAGGYFLEIDTDGDVLYDASGLGRVHKIGCDPRVCLSVPFPCSTPNYYLETPNPHPLSICGFKNTENGVLCSAFDGVKLNLISKNESIDQCSAVFESNLNGEPLFTEKYSVSDKGVDAEFCGADGILIPVFLFDGARDTDVTASDGQIVVKYNGSYCKYVFSGESSDYGVFFNRNGRYRAYKINTDKLHIEIGDAKKI